MQPYRLPDIPHLRLYFALESQEDARLPAYKGSLLRGSFGYLRDGVGLDRDLRTAAKGILYNFEAITSGVRFKLNLDLENPAPHEIGLVLTGLDLFANGFLSVGGKRSRGLGMVSFDDKKLVLRRFRPEDFFDAGKRQGAKVSADEMEGFRNEARRYYLEGGNG